MVVIVKWTDGELVELIVDG